MTEEVQAPQLALGDIEGCIKIIDIVTKRGAFEGSELADVGAVRNRLAAFLQGTIKDNKEQSPELVEEPEEEEEVEG
jgi:hypothetical protein